MDSMSSVPGARLPNARSVVRGHTGTTPRIGLPTGDYPGARAQHTGNKVQKHSGSKPSMGGGTVSMKKARSSGESSVRGAY